MSCRFVVFIDPFRCHVTAPSHIEAGPDLGGGGGGGGGGGNRGSCPGPTAFEGAPMVLIIMIFMVYSNSF